MPAWSGEKMYWRALTADSPGGLYAARACLHHVGQAPGLDGGSGLGEHATLVPYQQVTGPLYRPKHTITRFHCSRRIGRSEHEGLTATQAWVLAFIQAQMSGTGRVPRVRDITAHLRPTAWVGLHVVGTAEATRGGHFKPAWIRPDGAVAVAHAGVALLEAICRRKHAYEQRKAYCER